MKVVFMGTPDFAVPTLKKLINNNIDIIGVYTKAPSKVGRGYKFQNSPIHDLALEANLQVFTPNSLKNKDEQERLRDLKPDLIVLVAYGLILPKEVLDMPKYGCLNLHPSLLPRWRGAAPMQWPILAGDEETGVTIMEMGVGLDDGDILVSEKVKIENNMDIEDLQNILSEKGADLMFSVVSKIEEGKQVKKTKQDGSLVTYARKLEDEDGKINWNNTAEEISRQIRALHINPGVYFEFEKERIKILKAEIIKKNGRPGEILSKNFEIACKEDAIKPLILQRSGKKIMKLKDFLNGFRFDVGSFVDMKNTF